MERHEELGSIEEILDFAIAREREAQQMYLAYAGSTERKAFRQLLLSMAQMESEHERKLTSLRSSGGTERLFRPLAGADQRLDELLVPVAFSPDMEYADFLILVIRKEGEAEKLYAQLASAAQDGGAAELFRTLAGEERTHKAWAQERYDRDVLTEN
ncbi:MAG: ferritin family protein [Spirochaetales bacterium]|nr:ferritin family protein [Spirochaetales bacterium]